MNWGEWVQDCAAALLAELGRAAAALERAAKALERIAKTLEAEQASRPFR